MSRYTVSRYDASFAKYGDRGAYHWKEIGGHWLHHHAFTAERYRRTLAALGTIPGQRVLDYGCGDGALLGWISRRVGVDGEAHGYDPNPEGLDLARHMLARARLPAILHADLAELSDGYFDAVVCADVVEHVLDVTSLLQEIARLLRPDGRAVITTPIRLSELPEDPNHVCEWFPGDFAALLSEGPMRVIQHECFIPAAAPEVYFWRPPMLLGFPIFRLLCNLLSIYAGINALSWLRLRPRLFMMQFVVVKRTS